MAHGAVRLVELGGIAFRPKATGKS